MSTTSMFYKKFNDGNRINFIGRYNENLKRDNELLAKRVKEVEKNYIKFRDEDFKFETKAVELVEELSKSKKDRIVCKYCYPLKLANNLYFYYLIKEILFRFKQLIFENVKKILYNIINVKKYLDWG